MTWRGRQINERATLGARIVELRASLEALEKTARKTPPRTLAVERKRVEAAREFAPLMRIELERVTREWFALRRLLGEL